MTLFIWLVLHRFPLEGLWLVTSAGESHRRSSFKVSKRTVLERPGGCEFIGGRIVSIGVILLFVFLASRSASAASLWETEKALLCGKARRVSRGSRGGS